MKRAQQIMTRIGRLDLWMTVAATAIATLLLVAATPAQAQTFTVLHNFTGALDGKFPNTGLTMDSAGNLYGTTAYGGFYGNDCLGAGGNTGCGTIFKLVHKSAGWVFNPLYQFLGDSTGDGASPLGRVIFGPDGALYGTAAYGGLQTSGCNGCGTVFKLTPPPQVCRGVLCSWDETQLYAFSGGDGAFPMGEIAFDAAGNLYGATQSGGPGGYQGTAFELTPAHGTWTRTLLHDFGDAGGTQPMGGVQLDHAGNVYGTAFFGGDGQEGTVFQLVPSGSGWTLHVITYFTLSSGGDNPAAGVILDQAGNLYGATSNGQPNPVAFEISPFDGGWTYNTLYTWANFFGGGGPVASLVMDSAGNLYGTTSFAGAYSEGSVFELTPANGSWIYTDLHDFTGGSDGGYPKSNIVLDASGNLYGTASQGGQYSDGVIFEITP
ncbi:MAG: choice-of-anchor tandem repeat GloVer-containing protein [Candidatus Korobacteraceae bacterium]